MKKLTDEMVAKALGWKKRLTRGFIMEVWCRPSDGKICNFPKWTTSLDAIVGEIESRSLYWIVAKQFDGTYWASIRTKGAKRVEEIEAKTAPLALCHALLDYLKESKP